MSAASRSGCATQERSRRLPNTVRVRSSSHSSDPCSAPVSLLCRISSCLRARQQASFPTSVPHCDRGLALTSTQACPGGTGRSSPVLDNL